MSREPEENFIRCPNGHIAPEGTQFCPWCGADIRPGGGGGTQKIQDTENYRDTVPLNQPGAETGGRRTVTLTRPGDKRTIIKRPGDDSSPDAGQARLVGFLVSYTLSPSGKFFELREGRQNIGSGRASRIQVEDKMLSEEHAIILYRQGRFIFEDRLSSNGSSLNGQEAIGQLELKQGDQLTLGSHTYIFVCIEVEKHEDHQ
ncbi:MAG: FHA domain-containing protein [Candidatus Adiutrix sp.]|jgi:pSer/pThr/pTyr-binding forkhead associated (FHA) protein|nr:FHA domain-containing protein [Candidatus Adiutrix sp.]